LIPVQQNKARTALFLAVALLALTALASATVKGDITLLCDDSCGSVNGICEDGGVVDGGSAASYVVNGPHCAWGTDCTDCGTRRKSWTERGREERRRKGRKGEKGKISTDSTLVSPNFPTHPPFFIAFLPEH
jgi:hypothetical protein